MTFALRITTIFALNWLLSLAVYQPAAAGERPKTVIQPAQIRQYLEDYLDRQRHKMPQAKIRFRRIRLPQPFTVPKGRLTCEVTPADPRVLPSRRFNLIFRVDGRAVKNIAVSAALEVLAEVAVATGDLNRNTILAEQHIELAQRDLNRLRAPCFDKAELLGKRLKRALRKGDTVERSAVAFPPLIKRGELVTITARKGALTVTAKGLAQQNGHAGEMIRVRNISSHKDLVCKVTGPIAVAVEL